MKGGPETILCAAIYVDTGKAEPARRSYAYPATGIVFAGWRHGDCFVSLEAWAASLSPREKLECNLRDLQADGQNPEGVGNRDRVALMESIRGFNQGFLTSTGRFVSREEAAKIAVSAGQCASHITYLTSEALY